MVEEFVTPPAAVGGGKGAPRGLAGQFAAGFRSMVGGKIHEYENEPTFSETFRDAEFAEQVIDVPVDALETHR